MDVQQTLLLYAFELISGTTALVLGWVVSRQLKFESKYGEEMGEVRKDVAVVQESQKELKESFKESEERNHADHKDLLERIDEHHKTITQRIDTAIELIKNGH